MNAKVTKYKDETNKREKNISPTYRKHQTHPELILTATNQGWIDALCFYYLCKNMFVNSTVFNYRVSRLAATSRVSPYLVIKYVEQLQDHSLARKHAGNLTFISTRRAKRMFATGTLTRKYTIHLTPDDDLKDIKSKLLTKVVEFESSKQAHMIAVKQKFNSLLDPDQRNKKRTLRLKNLKRKYDFDYNGEKVNQKIGFSYRNFSELTGLSKTSFFRSLKHAAELKLIELNVTLPQMLFLNRQPYKMNRHEFEQVRDVISDQVGSFAYLSRHNEVLFQSFTEINLLQYPFKKMS